MGPPLGSAGESVVVADPSQPHSRIQSPPKKWPKNVDFLLFFLIPFWPPFGSLLQLLGSTLAPYTNTFSQHFLHPRRGLFQGRPILTRRVNPRPPGIERSGVRPPGLFGLSSPGLAWPGFFGFERLERKGKERKRKGKARPDISNFNENSAVKTIIC